MGALEPTPQESAQIAKDMSSGETLHGQVSSQGNPWDAVTGLGQGLARGATAQGYDPNLKPGEQAAANVGDFIGTIGTNALPYLAGPFAGAAVNAGYGAARETNRELHDHTPLNPAVITGQGALNLALGKVGMGGASLPAKIITGGAIGGASGGIAKGLEQYADTGHINPNSPDFAGAVGTGALLGGAFPVAGAAVKGMWNRHTAGTGGMDPTLAGHIAANEPGGAELNHKVELPPLGVQVPEMMGQYEELAKQYASVRHFFPNSEDANKLADAILKFGVDPDVAANNYLAGYAKKAGTSFATNYDPNVSQHIDQTLNQHQQDWAGNLSRSLRGISGYDATVHTPEVNQALTDQARNANRTLEGSANYLDHNAQDMAGLNYDMPPVGQPMVPMQPHTESPLLDTDAINQWLMEKEMQQNALQDTIERERARGVVPDTNVQTPNSDALRSQLLQQALMEAALRGQKVSQEQIQRMIENQMLMHQDFTGVGNVEHTPDFQALIQRQQGEPPNPK